ncbi:O-antigen ligase family protein [Sulfurovum sp.]|uniref:O-antigen ligase family protein n=1 Tax=Sulfurovum sp. TaxID=1969726 RepID=UPI0025D10407|nr:O-antigen ligase family protein [Sulfurovum sp.]
MRKLFRGKYQPLVLLVLMIALGAVTAQISQIAFLVGMGAFAIGMYRTILRRNRGGEAHLFAGFIVGAEVYLRMSFAGLPWEFGKIAVFLLLLTGWVVEKKHKPFPLLFLVYLLLLLPGIFVPNWESIAHFKKEFMFTFFGEVVLVMSVFYFYKRTLSLEDMVRFVRWILLGVIVTSALLFLKTPDYGSIHYGGGSNFAASGGFGPNQVAAILGLGMVLIGYALLTGRKIFVYRTIDVGMLLLFTLQGLFTLSRGGLIAAISSLVLGIVLLYLYNIKQAMHLLHIRFTHIVILGLVFSFAFFVSNNISSGAVERRYINTDKYGQQIKEDYTTKRGDIVLADWKTFLDHSITGAGIGGGRVYRAEDTGISAAHVELSRLPAEHGILGLFALAIMLLFPVWMFFRSKNAITRFTLVVFTGYGVLTMTHNAMRLALPSFLYGAGFIWILIENKHMKLKGRG